MVPCRPFWWPRSQTTCGNGIWDVWSSLRVFLSVSYNGNIPLPMLLLYGIYVCTEFTGSPIAYGPLILPVTTGIAFFLFANRSFDVHLEPMGDAQQVGHGIDNFVSGAAG